VRLIPVGLAVVAALQVVATAAAYPFLTLAVGLVASAYASMASPDGGTRTILVIAGLPMVFGALLMGAVFVVVPLAVCVVGANVIGRLGRRRGATSPVAQLLTFAATLVSLDVVALVAGIVLWPTWWYSEKLATLIPLWPLTACVTLNAVLDASLAGITLRSQLRTR
jgi:hypothetical protein